ncbi:MAG: hypothetical protein QXM07_09520 [Nitrososphaerota archaeon]
MYFNKGKFIELVKKLPEKKFRVLDEKHEKITLVLDPGEAGIIKIIKAPSAYGIMFDHWGATFNVNSLYILKLDGFTEYVSDEPVQPDDEHERLFEYKIVNSIDIIVYNQDTIQHEYKVDYRAIEIDFE